MLKNFERSDTLRPDLSGALFLCSAAEQKKAGTEGGNRRLNPISKCNIECLFSLF
jgi:hypothetical protein